MPKLSLPLQGGMCIKIRSYLDYILIYYLSHPDGQTRTSGVLLAAANEFWSEALLGCCPSGETMVEDFQVYLLDESVEEVEAYTTMLWSGRPPEGMTFWSIVVDGIKEGCTEQINLV